MPKFPHPALRNSAGGGWDIAPGWRTKPVLIILTKCGLGHPQREPGTDVLWVAAGWLRSLPGRPVSKKREDLTSEGLQTVPATLGPDSDRAFWIRRNTLQIARFPSCRRAHIRKSFRQRLMRTGSERKGSTTACWSRRPHGIHRTSCTNQVISRCQSRTRWGWRASCFCAPLSSFAPLCCDDDEVQQLCHLMRRYEAGAGGHAG